MRITHGEWAEAPQKLNLSNSEVHVWRADLNQSTQSIQQLNQTLSTDEKARAERFHFERHRRHFITGRGILRTILARYLNLEPDQLQFSYGSTGKPALAEMQEKDTLKFNLSHSHQLALFAVTCNRKVGIDLEHIRPVTDLELIAVRNFSNYENAILQALPENEKLEAFFNCWTRKEAYIKAIGTGLTLPLGQFDVSLKPGEPARLLNVADNPQEPDRWTLYDLRPAGGYASALAVEGTG